MLERFKLGIVRERRMAKKVNKNSAIGLGMSAAGAASFGLGDVAGKAASSTMKKASTAKNLAGYHAEMASESRLGAEQFYARGMKTAGDQLGKAGVMHTGEANWQAGRFESLAGKAMNLGTGSKVLKGLGVAGMALGAATAGIGMYQETKASYEEARSRKAAIRGARK